MWQDSQNRMADRMKKIYISGAITNDPAYRQKFAVAEKRLEHQGHLVLNPARLPAGLAYEEYLYIDLATITVCNAIYLLPCWTGSSGARREKRFAEALGKEVMYAPEGTG